MNFKSIKVFKRVSLGDFLALVRANSYHNLPNAGRTAEKLPYETLSMLLEEKGIKVKTSELMFVKVEKEGANYEFVPVRITPFMWAPQLRKDVLEYMMCMSHADEIMIDVVGIDNVSRL